MTHTEVNELLAEYSIIEIDEDIEWLTSHVARSLKTWYCSWHFF